MTLALHGGEPVRRRFPARPGLSPSSIRNAQRVIGSGELSGFLAGSAEGGEYVGWLERDVSERLATTHAVTMNSATSCLFATMRALEIGPGHEVICSPWSMSATAVAALSVGAHVVFADVEPFTYGLDAASVMERITRQTRAVIVTDLFGAIPRDLSRITDYCRTRDIHVVEDAAQAIGAVRDGQSAGTRGTVGVLSFNRHKTVQCGEGGVALTKIEKIADRLRAIRNHGEVAGDTWGGNHRLGEVEAAIALGELERVYALTAPRRINARRLSEGIWDLPGIEAPWLPSRDEEAWHALYLYAFRAPKAHRFAEALRAEGIEARPYVEPLYRLPCLRRYEETRLPMVEDAWRNVIVTPLIHAWMCRDDMDDVVRAVRKVHDHLEEL